MQTISVTVPFYINQLWIKAKLLVAFILFSEKCLQNSYPAWLEQNTTPFIALKNLIYSQTNIVSKLTSISMIWKSKLVKICLFRLLCLGYSYGSVKMLKWYHNLMIMIILCLQCIFYQWIIEWNTQSKNSIFPLSLSKNITNPELWTHIKLILHIRQNAQSAFYWRKFHSLKTFVLSL